MRAESLLKTVPGALLGCGLLLCATGCRSTATAVSEEAVTQRRADSVRVNRTEAARCLWTDSLALVVAAELDSVVIQSDSSGLTVRARAMRLNVAEKRSEGAFAEKRADTAFEAVGASENARTASTAVSTPCRSRSMPRWMYAALAVILFILIKKHTRL